MSIRVMTHVWADESIQDPYERLLLLALADFSNDKGESFPSVDTLATKCCLTSRGVIKVLERLEENGKISKKLGGGRGKSNLYTIILPQQDPFKKGEPYSVNPVQGKRNPERHSVNGVPETLNRVHPNLL